MRKFLLNTASTVALTLAGAAFAADTETNKAPAAGTEVQTQSGVEASGTTAAHPDLRADSMAETKAESKAGSMAETDTKSDYRSYDQSRSSFSGSIAGNMSADELMGTTIVDRDGNDVGKVNDLLIGHDGNITKVLVDVGGFLGIGARTVALDLDQLQPAQGSGDDLVIAMTKEQLKVLPRMERQDKTWREAAPEVERKLAPAERRDTDTPAR